MVLGSLVSWVVMDSKGRADPFLKFPACFFLFTFLHVMLHCFRVGFLLDFGAILASKILPKSTPNGRKIDQKLHQDVDQFFDRLLMALGPIFGRFGLEVGRPRDQKTLKNQWFLSIFAFSANLPTRGHLINFLVSLVSNLASKTFQNPSQEASKIDQKSNKK